MNTIEKYPEKLVAEALSKYSTPYGKPNPETYAYLDGAMNGSAGVWVTDGSLPKEDGSYFCYLSHDDNFPHEPPIKSSIEYRSKGGWVYLAGWKIIKWLDESVSSPSPQATDCNHEALTDTGTGCNYCPICKQSFPASPSPLEAETADKNRIAELEKENERLKKEIRDFNDGEKWNPQKY